MNHTLQNAMVLGILFSIVIIPILIISTLAKRKRKQKMKLRLLELSEKYHMAVSQSDFLHAKLIALDDQKKCLLYFDNLSENPPLFIELKEVIKIDIDKKITGEQVKSVKLSLQNKKSDIILVTFYEFPHDNESHLKHLIAKATEWQQNLTLLIQ